MTNISDDKTISYQISNLFEGDNPDKYRSRKSLKKDPPTLSFIDGDKTLVSLELTQEFTRDLKKALESTEKAYAGYSYHLEKRSFWERIKGIPNDAKHNPLTYRILVGVALFILVLFLYSKYVSGW